MQDDLDDVILEAKSGGFPRKRKLNRASVLKIREARREGAPIAAIARAAGVHEQTIYSVLSGKTWGRIK